MSKSFPNKAAASAWARALEAQIDTADLSPTVRDLRTMTVAELLKRYDAQTHAHDVEKRMPIAVMQWDCGPEASGTEIAPGAGQRQDKQRFNSLIHLPANGEYGNHYYERSPRKQQVTRLSAILSTGPHRLKDCLATAALRKLILCHRNHSSETN